MYRNSLDVLHGTVLVGQRLCDGLAALDAKFVQGKAAGATEQAREIEGIRDPNVSPATTLVALSS